MAVLTALTAQNTQGVTGVHTVPAGFVADQIRAIFADVRVDAIKIGMIANAEIAEAVADVLRPHRSELPIVLDPVMMAKGGSPLLAPDAINVVTHGLMPIASLVTPNLPEAAALARRGGGHDASRDGRTGREIAEARSERGSSLKVVILKATIVRISFPTLPARIGLRAAAWRRRTHTAPAARFPARLRPNSQRVAAPAQAVSIAKAYLAGAIAAADTLAVGSGHGPVQHFYNLWKN